MTFLSAFGSYFPVEFEDQINFRNGCCKKMLDIIHKQFGWHHIVYLTTRCVIPVQSGITRVPSGLPAPVYSLCRILKLTFGGGRIRHVDHEFKFVVAKVFFKCGSICRCGVRKFGKSLCKFNNIKVKFSICTQLLLTVVFYLHIKCDSSPVKKIIAFFVSSRDSTRMVQIQKHAVMLVSTLFSMCLLRYCQNPQCVVMNLLVLRECVFKKIYSQLMLRVCRISVSFSIYKCTCKTSLMPDLLRAGPVRSGITKSRKTTKNYKLNLIQAEFVFCLFLSFYVFRYLLR